MRLIPRVHDLYVGRAVLATVLLTWAVLLGLDVVNGFASEAKSIGQGNYSFGHAVAYVAYTVPRRAYTLFPTAAVIGALMGLGQLAATSELTALRALGVSRKRMSASVVAAMALLTATMVLSGETLAPWAQSQADTLKTSAKYQSNMATAMYSGLWAREGDTFLNALSGEEKLLDGGGTALVLHDVRLYQLDPSGRVHQITYAVTAEHRDGGWTLRQVRRDTFQERSVQRETLPELAWQSQLDPAALAAGLTRPRNLSAHDLGQSIEYRRRNGLDARDYEDQYWSRWFYPLNVLALCMAAIPFSFGSLRSGGLGKRLFLGILFALGFWLLQLFFGRMAGALRLDYRIAYALPPMVMLAVSAWLFRRRSS
ncbi:LPS export ABC transporter permease LptG [Xanthomonas maliensis]|uniref:LPS export ABC transporter permease LptG n=1 Tax=Xanthomonas maliensis TaxID=1321368 RepID=UPI0003A39177|nr:LPS export ABC transporter permease LptG [Xanthomonas maliensis]KAB7765513.1 LPS export ABC transporter permease LptG [Xanthomonas maliensis]